MLTFTEVLKKTPDLSANGIRTSRVTDAEFAEWRSDLENNFHSQVAAALRFLEGVQTSKAMARMRNSYGLKHTAESHQFGYICNGAMIAALLMVGVPIRRIPMSCSVQFAIERRWLDERAKVARGRYLMMKPAHWPHARPFMGPAINADRQMVEQFGC
ncbi:hypothetical protein [Dyella acidisoli]|uniref:Uncharacterized protein n=1 Tax=Dyella acidisoli TaxID=1867834 RepID=A0ABQ5XSE3_9GAMM|nr:hypothetical protein [Dyella acidisoli]GLQ93375.1 hypothetical protein GCM10007901_23260 [Dyella acidisoli]